MQCLRLLETARMDDAPIEAREVRERLALAVMERVLFDRTRDTNV